MKIKDMEKINIKYMKNLFICFLFITDNAISINPNIVNTILNIIILIIFYYYAFIKNVCEKYMKCNYHNPN